MTSSAPAIGRAASLVAKAVPPAAPTATRLAAPCRRRPSEQCLPVSRNVNGPMGHTVLDTVEDIKKTLLLLGSSPRVSFQWTAVNG